MCHRLWQVQCAPVSPAAPQMNRPTRCVIEGYQRCPFRRDLLESIASIPAIERRFPRFSCPSAVGAVRPWYPLKTHESPLWIKRHECHAPRTQRRILPGNRAHEVVWPAAAVARTPLRRNVGISGSGLSRYQKINPGDARLIPAAGPRQGGWRARSVAVRTQIRTQHLWVCQCSQTDAITHALCTPSTSGDNPTTSSAFQTDQSRSNALINSDTTIAVNSPAAVILRRPSTCRCSHHFGRRGNPCSMADCMRLCPGNLAAT